jgi:hypothetical protein
MDGGRGEGQEEEKSATRLHWQRGETFSVLRIASRKKRDDAQRMPVAAQR